MLKLSELIEFLEDRKNFLVGKLNRGEGCRSLTQVTIQLHETLLKTLKP